MRVQINMRVSNDLNTSYSFTELASTVEEAHDFGRRASALVTAWRNGWLEHAHEEREEGAT